MPPFALPALTGDLIEMLTIRLSQYGRKPILPICLHHHASGKSYHCRTKGASPWQNFFANYSKLVLEEMDKNIILMSHVRPYRAGQRTLSSRIKSGHELWTWTGFSVSSFSLGGQKGILWTGIWDVTWDRDNIAA